MYFYRLWCLKVGHSIRKTQWTLLPSSMLKWLCIENANSYFPSSSSNLPIHPSFAPSFQIGFSHRIVFKAKIFLNGSVKIFFHTHAHTHFISIDPVILKLLMHRFLKVIIKELFCSLKKARLKLHIVTTFPSFFLNCEFPMPVFNLISSESSEYLR